MKLQLLYEPNTYSSRLLYAAQVLLEYVLGLDICFVNREGGLNRQWPTLVYGKHESLPFVPETDFLLGNPKPVLPKVLKGSVALGHTLDSADQLHYDPFAAAFYAISLSHLYGQSDKKLDKHGRYNFKTAYPYTTSAYMRPVVHEIGEAFWEWLSDFYPSLKRRERTFKPIVTLDIDYPWRYLHKPKYVQYGGLLKEKLKQEPEAKVRQKVLAGKRPDPNDTHEELMSRLSDVNTLAFFLFDGSMPYDNRFRSSQKSIQKLVQQYRQAGFEIAIHPSYGCDADAKQYAQQKRALENIIDAPIQSARMHYVKYQLPDTYRIALGLGIRHEYSTLAPHANGFLHGMCVPFPWYDFEAEQKTELILHPTIAMDRTHQLYMQQSPNEAAAELRQLVESVKRHNGEFVWLLHNEILSDFAEWKGWRTYFDEGLKALTTSD